jgi:hypothetical protein
VRLDSNLLHDSTPVVQPPAKDPVAELVDKLNACMPARSGADVADNC